MLSQLPSLLSAVPWLNRYKRLIQIQQPTTWEIYLCIVSAYTAFGQHMEIYQFHFCSQFLHYFLFLVLSMSLTAQINSLS